MHLMNQTTLIQFSLNLRYYVFQSKVLMKKKSKTQLLSQFEQDLRAVWRMTTKRQFEGKFAIQKIWSSNCSNLSCMHIVGQKVWKSWRSQRFFVVFRVELRWVWHSRWGFKMLSNVYEVLRFGLRLLLSRFLVGLYIDKRLESIVGWYEGFPVGMPSTNNCLEGFNGVLKTKYDLRGRLPMAQFTQVRGIFV